MSENFSVPISHEMLLNELKRIIEENISMRKELKTLKGDGESDVRKLVANKARCPRCGETIESKYTHDFQTCKCGATSVDGGLTYLRRCFDPEIGFIECSEYLGGVQ